MVPEWVLKMRPRLVFLNPIEGLHSTLLWNSVLDRFDSACVISVQVYQLHLQFTACWRYASAVKMLGPTVVVKRAIEGWCALPPRNKHKKLWLFYSAAFPPQLQSLKLQQSMPMFVSAYLLLPLQSVTSCLPRICM